MKIVNQRASKYREWPRNAGPVWLLIATVLAGCGGKEPSEADAKAKAELAVLQTANKEVAKLRADNADLARLQKDNEELRRMRSVSDDLAAAKTANDQLRAQLNLEPEQLAALLRQGAQSGLLSTAPLVSQLTGASDAASLPPKVDPDIPEEGDDIFIEPRYLRILMPEYGTNWDRFEKRPPISVTNLLKDRGIVITNYNQLRELGLTNFSIQKAPPSKAPTR